MPLDWPLALAMLVVGPSLEGEWQQRLNGPVAELGIALEVWDRKERDQYLKGHDLDHALAEYLSPYYRQMLECPSLASLNQFQATHQTACQFVEFNRRYVERLDAGRFLHWDLDEIDQAMNECDGLRRVWSLYETASSPNHCWTTRRHALKDLRCLLEEEAFAAGWMPSPVPLRRFQRMR